MTRTFETTADDVAVSADADARIRCDGWCHGANEATMIGSKGYAYCGTCSVERPATSGSAR